MHNINYADAVTTDLGTVSQCVQRNRDELQRKTGVRIAQLKNCPDVTRNFWFNSLYSRPKWLCYCLQTFAVGRMAQKMGFAPCCCTYKRSKKRVKMPPKLLFWGRKNEFFSGEARPLSRTPPPRRLAPPSEILNTPLNRMLILSVQRIPKAKDTRFHN